MSYEDKDRGTYDICIGGDILSRGFTVEGLSVSRRHSKAQDTYTNGKMVYRVGGSDLCRVKDKCINDDFTLLQWLKRNCLILTFMEQNNLTPREFKDCKRKRNVTSYWIWKKT